MNLSIICGRLGRDPELRYDKQGNPICDFSLATNHKGKDSEQVTDWHKCVAFGRTAEIICQYRRKGSELLVEGRSTIEEYISKDGTKCRVSKVMVSHATLIGERVEGGPGSSGPPPERRPPAQPNPQPAPADDDVPF